MLSGNRTAADGDLHHRELQRKRVHRRHRAGSVFAGFRKPDTGGAAVSHQSAFRYHRVNRHSCRFPAIQHGFLQSERHPERSHGRRGGPDGRGQCRVGVSNRCRQSWMPRVTQLAFEHSEHNGQINALAANISQLNVQTASSTAGESGTDANLRSDLDQLSSLVDITVTTAPNGTCLGLGRRELPLVLGDQSYALSANPTAAPGSQISSSAGGNSPTSFSGQLGALLQTQNGTIAQLIGGMAIGQPEYARPGFRRPGQHALSSGTTAAGNPGRTDLYVRRGKPRGDASRSIPR